ncbi:MAG: MazG family protein [Ruminococcaceae bacterium]|nr:MazG family protein [Oscillospiraceae bacterium]
MKEQSYIAWRDEKIAELLSRSSYDFQDLCDIVTILRGEGGCPWDIEQDHHSIRKGMIEECYEVVEAIDRDDTALLREELGDVLLQIVFHSDMEKDAGHFNITDVANDECVKMIHRHPHVFGQVKADTSEQVLANWEVIKTEEKQRVSLSDQLQAIPPILPALMRAQKVGKKMNADADLSDAALLDTTIEDLHKLSNYDDPAEQKQIIGEALFRITTLCRRMGLEAEEALTASTEEKIKSVE